ncbi:kinesin-like protein KIF25 isoform X2 [Nematostella vectensis]|uniref:kinesin-like protein KIF25 isoform X2 n=1 Tax=Nematostella vectensis TaxID=45351 RepID=UPI0020775141|nr:kinesin-like protein KIF25 isoform X2 [Nematostella vectensis]
MLYQHSYVVNAGKTPIKRKDNGFENEPISWPFSSRFYLISAKQNTSKCQSQRKIFSRRESKSLKDFCAFCTMQAREERIVALETENAMLYLKLAECQGTVRSSRYESSHFRRLFEAEEGFKKNVTKSIKTCYSEVRELKENLNSLKSVVAQMPEELSTYVEKAKFKTTKFGSEEMTNMEKMQSKLMETEMQLDMALQRAAAEKDRRKTLHNTLVEIRGNIRVHCRLRPLIGVIDAHGDGNIGQAGTPSEQVVHAIDEETLSVVPNKPGGGASQPKIYEFERVYNEETDQKAVFSDVAPLLTSLLDGYNVCIMAYGQTGSGKTHTMLGSHDIDVEMDSEQLNKDEGIIPRAAKELFRLMAERETATESYSVEIAVCEIYNNDVRDLLAPSKNVEKLSIVTSSEGDTEIPSLVTKPVTTVQELMSLVYYGMCRRHEDATNVHAHSSRSHLIVQLQLYTITNQQTARVATPTSEAAPSPPGTPTQPRRSNLPQPSKNHASRSQSPAPPRGRSLKRSKSPAPGSAAAARSRSPSPARSSTSTPPTISSVKTKLQLVDLAGSESVGMSGVTGAALRETSFINKSLSALADVLGALAEHRSHIPYRNTRLTHMLQDTIGGNAKLLVMLCVSPAQRFITETYQCIGFGSRARQVARGPAKKRRPTSFNPSNQLSLDLSQLNSALRSNGSLSPRFNPNRRRGSNFTFPDT